MYSWAECVRSSGQVFCSLSQIKALWLLQLSPKQECISDHGQFSEKVNGFFTLKRSQDEWEHCQEGLKNKWCMELIFCHPVSGMNLWSDVCSWIYRDWLITMPFYCVVLVSFFGDAMITDSKWNSFYFLLKSLLATCAITCTLTFIPRCT